MNGLGEIGIGGGDCGGKYGGSGGAVGGGLYIRIPQSAQSNP